QTVAMALYGTVIGALMGGLPADRYGRKVTLFWIAILYFVSAVGSALAPNVYWLMFFRFIGGLGVGASSVVAPVYISEIAPTSHRGRLTALFQFNIVLGILLAYVSNYLIGTGVEGSWRWMLGVEAFPAFLFVVLVLTVPRSPRWLVVKRGNVDEALAVLKRIDPESAAEQLAAIQASDVPNRSAWKEFWSGRYRFPILLAFLVAFFNQMSGINAVIYYAPRIFDMTGMGADAALLSTAGIGLVNLVFTLAGMVLIDYMGRRFLMYVGSVGYIVSLAAVAYAFFTESFGGVLVPIWLFVFIASHAIGQGAVIWVFISEIFPNEVRAFGQSLGCGTHWVMAALVAGVFPFFAGLFGGGPIFAFFSFMMVLQLLFVWKMMPETKGVSLEELQERLVGKAAPVPATPANSEG
ncbi:MAG: MFS transporter, partial [Bacteroidetes bacterium]